MSAAKHTPGPWTLTDDPVRRVIRGGRTKQKTICIIEDWTTDADAKLLALAPDLLQSLRWLLPLAEAYLRDAPSHPDNAKLETARAAILVAEGR